MAIKLDIEKAYDMLDWNFIKKCFTDLRFLVYVNWMMQCIITLSFKVIVNGKTRQSFQLEQRIRQGNPIPPYIFIICGEHLGRYFHFMLTHKF